MALSFSSSHSKLQREPGFHQHEPGPNDAPGPRYPSYDSAPSFGNFGPLPDDVSTFNNRMLSTWTVDTQSGSIIYLLIPNLAGLDSANKQAYA